jgi:multicomponent Na+:H+ antiporter subunit C
MSTAFLYSITGILIFVIGVHGMLAYAHLLRKALAMNIMGTGIFLFLVALADRGPEGVPDPVPHGMVLTGIVVSVSATAFILALVVHLYMATGETDFEQIEKEGKEKNA